MDRGHMCPAGDNRWHWKAMQESFYMTNICPHPFLRINPFPFRTRFARKDVFP